MVERGDSTERRLRDRRSSDEPVLVAIARLEEQLLVVAADAKRACAGVHGVRDLITATKEEIRMAMADEHRRLDKVEFDQQRRGDRVEFILADQEKEVVGLRSVHEKLRACSERLAMTPGQQVQDSWRAASTSTRLKLLGALVAVLSAPELVKAIIAAMVRALGAR